jgi:hypothetical protein
LDARGEDRVIEYFPGDLVYVWGCAQPYLVISIEHRAPWADYRTRQMAQLLSVHDTFYTDMTLMNWVVAERAGP